MLRRRRRGGAFDVRFLGKGSTASLTGMGSGAVNPNLLRDRIDDAADPLQLAPMPACAVGIVRERAVSASTVGPLNRNGPPGP